MDNRFSIGGDGITARHSRQTTHPQQLNNNHCHEYFEILYIIEGSGRFVVEGEEYPVHSGCLFLIRPYKYHFVNIELEKPYERYVLHFSLSSLPSNLRPLFLPNDDKKNELCTYFSAGNVPATIRSTLERLDVVTTLSEEKRMLYLSLLVSEVVVLLSDAHIEREVHHNSELGARVIRYLNDHIEEPISLDDIARHFFVSKFYLCRAFKKHNGISIHGYITQKRVMLAKKLMESGESASGAAYRVGFCDYSAFYRAYIKILGTSPVASRGERRENVKNS
ncbi:MAG: AraC family transcriptional regulator [Clostridia bacterium]|nr:AraC family transcriptional regulator [Clostridia bacterium]